MTDYNGAYKRLAQMMRKHEDLDTCPYCDREAGNWYEWRNHVVDAHPAENKKIQRYILNGNAKS